MANILMNHDNKIVLATGTHLEILKSKQKGSIRPLIIWLPHVPTCEPSTALEMGGHSATWRGSWEFQLLRIVRVSLTANLPGITT